MDKAELLRLWNDKVTRNVPLSEAEKNAFIDAYWGGRLPRVPHYDVTQWVEDGCRSFAAS